MRSQAHRTTQVAKWPETKSPPGATGGAPAADENAPGLPGVAEVWRCSHGFPWACHFAAIL
ncbi:hypothetical protein C4K37_2791 [Pseudomonas chlororaphis subsp. piscium]|nr:hypothetical protein C4K37_2791 [Pseudomonas chlororaphis subsp. piscium]AZC43725.1 hypothetical protein C4K36_2800 [Pseudomonas chlororaphis subsp. piscium]AZC50372.1 hypothetical protein C4K35_2789 [Pseudomonas chlororaphis subsp. piscium]AZC75582.1 hypothetical protein C4K31_2679 [Pseudomonas chlororaphis subsp. piscium]AZC95439.1 hypothetical protein C4K28_2711 [Pseudomonas chlororaphis subsp. piscium]